MSASTLIESASPDRATSSMKRVTPLYRGSRKHILDLRDSGSFQQTLNNLLEPTGVTVGNGECWPKGYQDPREARIGKTCGQLCDDALNIKMRDWWLAIHRGANVPNWDLACKAAFPGGREGLVLVEAKAHEQEFANGWVGKAKGRTENDVRIGRAIDEAKKGLEPFGPVQISRDRWYQLSNRAAFAWKLASEGVPVVLLYLGFTGDEGISEAGLPLKNHAHWEAVVAAQPVLPIQFWEKRLDVNGSDLWFLLRSVPCLEQSPPPVARSARDEECSSALREGARSLLSGGI